MSNRLRAIAADPVALVEALVGAGGLLFGLQLLLQLVYAALNGQAATFAHNSNYVYLAQVFRVVPAPAELTWGVLMLAEGSLRLTAMYFERRMGRLVAAAIGSIAWATITACIEAANVYALALAGWGVYAAFSTGLLVYHFRALGSRWRRDRTI